MYENEDVKPELFEQLRQEYKIPTGDGTSLLAADILEKYGYKQDRKEFLKSYRDDRFVPTYIENPQDIALGINELTTSGAFVGVYSNTLKKRSPDLVAAKDLGIPEDQHHWFNGSLPKIERFKALDMLAKHQSQKNNKEYNTYILIDNNQEEVAKFVQDGRKSNVSTLAMNYTLPKKLVTIDRVRAEIEQLRPEPIGAGISD